MTSIPQQIKTIRSHYDYAMIWKFIHVKGIEIYGPRFILYEEDTLVITKLMAYFLQDKDLAEHFAVDLTKGIMLTGPVGCGKTSMMNLMRYLLPAEYRYSVKACRDIAMAYAQDGYPIIQRYTRLSFNPYTKDPICICFDDLGLEKSVQYFGNECNSMAEILLSRYEHFIHQNMLTHLTTNLSAQEIQERYGIRIRSRCRELFNLMAFNSTSIDKRK